MANIIISLKLDHSRILTTITFIYASTFAFVMIFLLPQFLDAIIIKKIN